MDGRSDNVFAHAEFCHIRPHSCHHAGYLVAENSRKRESDVSGGHMQVRVAEAAGPDFNE
jgi:hypothetical protein